MLTLDELKDLHDKAYQKNMITRERASDDLVFYWISQWDDNLLGGVQLQYRGEFNILRKAGRQITSDLRANPVQIDFKPKGQTRDDDADIIDGIYRTDDMNNCSIESYDNAKGETVVCGIGGWELYTDYETDALEEDKQEIRRRPLYEFNNNVYCDPNAKLLDKSDANYWSILTPYSEDGYKKLVEELTGEEPDMSEANFRNPEESFTFPWAAGKNRLYYVTNFYHREKVRDKVLFLIDPLGQPLALRESDVLDVIDELQDEGYEITGDKEIERWEVTKYIASGAQIIKTCPIAGQELPVVPYYGERAFVEGEEHYEGVTRLAKDPSRLRNFQLSYLADIVSKSPRNKPIFTARQIQGFEFMYEETGADNDYPYYLQNPTDEQGNLLPEGIGPAGQMPNPEIPQALAASIPLAREAVSDVADPGLPQDIADPDLSGKAVIALQNRLDMQSMVYQDHFKHAKRRDAEIYKSMAQAVYDTPREVTLTLPDGSQRTAQIMESVLDEESGELVVVNDLTSSVFDVYADIGPAYSTLKEQTLDKITAAAQMTEDPNMKQLLSLSALTMIDGIDVEPIRKYARKQLVLQGFIEPETDEEMDLMRQAATQQQQPDPALLLAMAENKKGEAALLREQRNTMKDAADAENQEIQTQIDIYKAQTERGNLQVNAAKAGADIDYKNMQTLGQRLDNANKATQAFQGRLRPRLRLVE